MHMMIYDLIATQYAGVYNIIAMQVCYKHSHVQWFTCAD